MIPPNVKVHPTVLGASVVCGNVDGIGEGVKLEAGHRSACSVLLALSGCSLVEIRWVSSQIENSPDLNSVIFDGVENPKRKCFGEHFMASPNDLVGAGVQVEGRNLGE